jgi:hypothetical protein
LIVRGVYPGSFDPLTVAHLAIADAAIIACELERLDLVISQVALEKDHGGHTSVAARLAAIARVAGGGRPWLGGLVTDAQLIVDIASGYDVCIMGSDKWLQVNDSSFYGGSAAARDDALARLPRVAVVPRDGFPLPPDAGVTVLDIAPEHRNVSSTAVRAGRTDWLA